MPKEVTNFKILEDSTCRFWNVVYNPNPNRLNGWSNFCEEYLKVGKVYTFILIIPSEIVVKKVKCCIASAITIPYMSPCVYLLIFLLLHITRVIFYFNILSFLFNNSNYTQGHQKKYKKEKSLVFFLLDFTVLVFV